MIKQQVYSHPAALPEKRRDPRAFLTVAVTLVIGDRIVRGTECRNISLSGMLIRVSEKLDKETEAVVTLTKRCEDQFFSFAADCRVSRFEESEKGSYVGVVYTGMSPRDKQNLHQIVDFQFSLMYKERLFFDEDRLKGITFKIADTKEELEQSFRLLHDMYVRERFIEPHPSGMRISLYNAAPFTVVMVGKKENEVVLTTTLYVDSFLGIPAENTFREEIGLLRAQGRYIAEVGSLAARTDIRNTDQTIQLYLQKMILLYALNYLKLDDMVITAVKKHQLYYRYIHLLDSIGEPRHYENANNTVVTPLRQNLENIEQRYRKAYHYLPPEKKLDRFLFEEDSTCISLPEEKAPVRVWDTQLAEYFFCKSTDIFADRESKKVSRIRSYYHLQG